MKIYAIRDRMLDYLQTPFVGPNDKAVMQSIAHHINNPEATDALAQAPHHFEILQLGEITEDGLITAHRELVADCSSLIRPGIRGRGAGEPGNQPDTPPDRKIEGEAGNLPRRETPR